MTELFHVREEALVAGDLISPGRWGSTVLSLGVQHPFFFREHLLEIWRRQFTGVQVSRLACTYAHEGLEQAENTSDLKDFIYRVEPIDVNTAKARLDMLWLTWMGEPGRDSDDILGWCKAYWAGAAVSSLYPAVNASWEWLFSCPLRVMEIIRRGT